MKLWQSRTRFLLRPRGILVLAATAGLVLGTGAGVASAQTQASGPATHSATNSAIGAWHNAVEAAGSATLNTGGNADAGLISCSGAGDCLVAGTFETPGSHVHPFLISQISGKWGQSQLVPGLAALDLGNYASPSSVSCSGPGNCTVGGSYRDKSAHQHAWVASEVRWKWSRAHQLPGMAALNKGDGSTLISVSCISVGSCTADGDYTDSQSHGGSFVVTEAGGTWGAVQQVPGLAALATAGASGIGPVSCHSVGNCSAGGSYEDGPDSYDGYVVSQVRGTWGKAVPIPGLKPMNTGGQATINGLACGWAGDCVVGGTYTDLGGDRFTFLASQVSGTWGHAEQVPGMAAIATGGDGEVDAVSCSSAGNCAAGGIAGINNGFDYHGGGQAFVVTETNGTWGQAEVVPGTARLNSGADGGATTLSCPRPGNCTVAGYYGVGEAGQEISNLEVFVASQVSGKWGQAAEIPGTAALNRGHFGIMGQVACPAEDQCSAGGSYDTAKGWEAFVASQS